MKNGSILIISNNSQVAKRISDKIKLLRECDKIKCVSFIEAISVLNSCSPSIIILYWSKSDSVNIVKEIRAIKTLDKVPIIFVMDSLIEDILFCAFDYGIDEFFNLDEPDSVILMRIFLSLQKSILYRKIDTNDEILNVTNIIDKKTGVYTNEYTPTVLKHFINKCIEENMEETIFMHVKTIPLDKKYLNINKIASLIKSVPRSNDIVASAEHSGFYLILYNAGIIGAKSVLQRIKRVLDGACEVYANSAEITLPYEEIQPVLAQAINEQMLAKNEFNYFYESDIKDYIAVMNPGNKNSKLSKEKEKELFNKFEKIVIPVFYHYQTVYKETFGNADINFSTDEDESYFAIKQDSSYAKISITIPMYSRVILETTYETEGYTSSTKKLSYDFKEFNEAILSSVLKNFINEFTERISHNTLSQTE